MMYKAGDSYYAEFTTSQFSTGEAYDATGTPTVTATRNGTDDGAFTLTATKIDTGRYKITGTVPAYTAGDRVHISVAATVDGVSGKAVVDSFIVMSETDLVPVSDFTDSFAEIVAIKAKTDDLTFSGTDVKATLDGEEVTPTTASKTGYALTADYDAAKTAAQAGDAMTLEDDAITSAKFDESTAFPIKSADTGATQIARVGADGDTLETLSDQIDSASTFDASSDTVLLSDTAKADISKIVHRAGYVLVEHTGDNDASGAALKSAVEAASAGTTVLVGHGTFNLTSPPITVPVGVLVKGAGINRTKITSTTNTILLRQDSGLEDLWASNTTNAPVQTYALPIAPTGSANVRLTRVRISGEQDCIYLSGNYASDWTMLDCEFDGPFDLVTLVTATATRTLRFYRCSFRSVGAQAQAVRCVRADTNGQIFLYDCHLYCIQTSGGSDANAIKVEGGTVEAYRCNLYANSVDGNEYNVNVSSGSCVLVDCDFDRTKVTGTFTDIKTLSGTQTFNVTGSITGDLSGSVGSVTGDVGGDVVGSVGSVTDPVTLAATTHTGAVIPTVTDVTTKTGYKLASDGLDSVDTTAPSGVASNFREMLVAVWRRFYKKCTLTATSLKTYADNGTDVLTTQTVSDDETTQTQGEAS